MRFVVFSSGFLTLDPMEVLSALSFWQQVSPPWKVSLDALGKGQASCPFPIFFFSLDFDRRTWKELDEFKGPFFAPFV